MVEQSFQNFFLAIAGASAALIGLLFVAVSVAPEMVVGPKALALHQVRAGLALTSFASSLVLSLIALMPDAHIGWPSTVIGSGGAVFACTQLVMLRRSPDRRAQRRGELLLLAFGLAMVLLAVTGIRMVADPHSGGPVSTVGTVVIALIALGVDRSWELVGGRANGAVSRLADKMIGDGTDQAEARQS